MIRYNNVSTLDIIIIAIIYNIFVQEVESFLRHLNVKADIPRMELILILAVRH